MEIAPDAAPFFAARRPQRGGGSGRSRPVRPRTYTAEELLDALRRWATAYGEPPRYIDWEPARARRLGHGWRAERYEAGRWPTARMVRWEFGRFNDAVRRAGLPARPAPGRLRPNLAGPEAVIEAILEWTRRYGDVPAMADWDPVRARRLRQEWRIARYATGDWPSARSVTNHFGSFGAAVRAAGLVPRFRSATRAERDAARQANRFAVATRTAEPPADLAALAAAVRAVAAARNAGDPVAVHMALIDVAAAALGYAAAGPVDR